MMKCLLTCLFQATVTLCLAASAATAADNAKPNIVFEPRNQNAAQKLERARKRTPKEDELYNLGTDPAETKDVHAANAELAAKLRQLLAEGRDKGRTR